MHQRKAVEHEQYQEVEAEGNIGEHNHRQQYQQCAIHLEHISVCAHQNTQMLHQKHYYSTNMNLTARCLAHCCYYNQMTKRYHAHCIRCYTLPYCRRSQPAQDEIPYEDFHQCTAIFINLQTMLRRYSGLITPLQVLKQNILLLQYSTGVARRINYTKKKFPLYNQEKNYILKNTPPVVQTCRAKPLQLLHCKLHTYYTT